MQLTLIPEKDINEFFLSKHFVLQEFEPDFDYPFTEDYHGFLIMPEFPNGGMTAISLLHTETKRWWSIPTCVHEFNSDLPDFDYGNDDKAIAWVKSLIDEYLGIIPNPKIDCEGNGGADYLEMELVENGIKVSVGHCCVTRLKEEILPIEVITAIISDWLIQANDDIEQGIANVWDGSPKAITKHIESYRKANEVKP